VTSDGASAADAERMAMLEAIASAFDRHDLAGILEHFADDAVFESPGGPEAWGRRFVGKDAVREAFAGRFSSIPDVRYTDASHFVAGDRGVSQWTLSGTIDGEWTEFHGCDIWTFRDGEVVLKDSYWKARSRPGSG
jgi:ketosteroid isomerase-like protein